MFASEKVVLFDFVISLFIFSGKNKNLRPCGIFRPFFSWIFLTGQGYLNLCEREWGSKIASYSFITFKQISFLVNIQREYDTYFVQISTLFSSHSQTTRFYDCSFFISFPKNQNRKSLFYVSGQPLSRLPK